MKRFFLYLAFCSVLTSCALQKRVEVGHISTPQGDIVLWLSDDTPNHKKSFLELAKAGYWNTYSFNRVIPNFVAQGGCPDTPEGFNDPNYLLAPEFSPKLRHVYGALGAGRDNNPKMLSARCQFYIVQNKNGLARLDDKYTIFGHVIQGMDVVDKIVNVPRSKEDEPLVRIPLTVSIKKLKATDVAEMKKSAGVKE